VGGRLPARPSPHPCHRRPTRPTQTPHGSAGGSIAIPSQRRSARALLLDAHDRVLLLRFHDPIEPRGHWWQLPGGGLQPGEDTASACRRELAEETGIRLASVSACIWVRAAQFRFGGHDICQREWIHLARLVGNIPHRAGPDLDHLEQHALLGQHWWTVAELTTSTESFIPPQLASLLTKLLSDGPPPHPIDISDPPTRPALTTRRNGRSRLSGHSGTVCRAA
jgi:8-oxo-dGTP pyrophosphatase MutT (NUDIX family)